MSIESASGALSFTILAASFLLVLLGSIDRGSNHTKKGASGVNSNSNNVNVSNAPTETNVDIRNSSALNLADETSKNGQASNMNSSSSDMVKNANKVAGNYNVHATNAPTEFNMALKNNQIKLDASKVPIPTGEFGRRINAQLFGKPNVNTVSEPVLTSQSTFGAGFLCQLRIATSANPKVNFRALESSVPEDAEFYVGIPIASVEEINNRLKNTLYGYFFGKRLAFPVVELYIRNAWSADNVLQRGYWMIRGTPIFLNKWSPSVSLTKEELSKVPVWVKMHDIRAYTSDELSTIATKLGTPMMLDAFTSNNICLE
ncbi:zinc knuckle CX2CX4HX4C containing protein [Tanacetum coccineum]